MVEQVWDHPSIHCIQVLLPENPLRSLNSYVIQTEHRSLIIDTGFNRPECWQALWAGIDELGLNLSQTALLLTHFHSDHMGLVWDFVEKGIPVYMGKQEWEYYTAMSQTGVQSQVEPIYSSEGFPPEQLALQSTGNQGRMFAPKPGFSVTPLADGEAIPLMDIETRIVYTPGHTPGHVVLYLPQEQLLFTGDHILFDITPNISVWKNVQGSLDSYINSLQKIRTLPIRAAFPAHRTRKDNVYTRIDQLIEHHGQRLNEIYECVFKNRGATAYELAGKITWSARNIKWEEFPPHQRWFAMGETLAHLYYLVDRGQIVRTQRNGTFIYYPDPGVQTMVSKI